MSPHQTHEAALNAAAFVYDLVSENAWIPRDIPANLADRGFTQCGLLEFNGATGMKTVVMEHPTEPFQILYDKEPDGSIGTCAALLPASREVREALIGVVKGKPYLQETTKEVVRHIELFPDMLAVHLRRGRFWTSKERGEMGFNLAVHPYPPPHLDGAALIAFSVERNLSLNDPKTAEDEDAQFNDTSQFARYIDIFQNVGMTHGDDLAGIVAAAQADGFNAKTGETRGSWSGGLRDDLPMNECTIRMQLNQMAPTDFEFAVFFRMDPDLTASRIRKEAYKRLNITGSTGPAEAIINGETYEVSLGIESATFGNYYLLLSK